MEEATNSLEMAALAEPYRIKMVEPIRLLTRAEREQALRDAFYSMTYINSADVFIGLATDSGTGAMSDRQWAAMLTADEAYVRSRSFFRLEKAIREILGYQYVVPTHQGRAAENILAGLLVKPDQIVLSNTHFDTVRAHIALREYGAKVPFISITISNNMACSSPVSMDNIRQVSRLAKEFG